MAEEQERRRPVPARERSGPFAMSRAESSTNLGSDDLLDFGDLRGVGGAPAFDEDPEALERHLAQQRRLLGSGSIEGLRHLYLDGRVRPIEDADVLDRVDP